MFKKMFMVGVSIFMVLTLGACGNADFPAEGNAVADPLLENKTEPASKTLYGESIRYLSMERKLI